jgi:thioredoxin-dependent peroxiredoxin
MEVHMLLATGSVAPDFQLADDLGIQRKLSDYRGKAVVLYFYPRDDTPGCTTEACHFRDDYSSYQKSGVTILGVSADTVASHVKFKEKYQLPFPLLADVDHKVCELYGVWGKKPTGNTGIFRTTYLIGKDGKVVKVYENVKPAEHSAEVLAELEAVKN